jgi:hypothetical protein
LTGAIDDHIGGASFENGDNGFGERLGTGVDGVGGSELAGFGELVIVEVGGDDGIGASEMGTENGSEADAAAADDQDRFTDLHLGIVVDDAEPGGEGIGEQGADFEIGVGWNGGDAILGEDGVLLERGDAAGVHGATLPGIERAAGLDAASGAPMADDAIADFDMANFGADFEDSGAGFVAKQVREPAIGAFDAVDFADLRAADAGDVDVDEHLTETEAWQLDLIEDERLALFHEDRGGGFHGARGGRISVRAGTCRS